MLSIPYQLPASIEPNTDYWLNIQFTLAVDTLWAQTRYEMAWAQFELPVKNTSLIETINLSPAPLKCLEVDHKLMVEGEDFTIKFNLAFGTLDSWDYQGVSLIKSAPKLQFWRALIDNDHRLANSWKEFGLHWLQHRINQVEWELTKDKDKVVIRSKARIAPPILAWGIQVTYIYTIESTGEVTIAMQGSMEGDKPQTLPRIGLQMEIPDCFDHVSWYGRGPGEAYCDSKEANRVGVYTKKVEELYTPYIYPQENGNRHEVRWVSVTNEIGTGFLSVGKPNLDFSAHYYSTEAWTKQSIRMS